VDNLNLDLTSLMEEPISGHMRGLRPAFHREERGEQVRKSSRPGCTVMSSCPSGDDVVVHEDEGEEE